MGNWSLFFADNFTLNLPNKFFWAEQIKKGIIPFWNPYVFSGTPFLADINLGTFYPLNLFYLFLSPPTALNFNIIADLLICFFGTYLLGKKLNLSKASCLFLSILFTFSGSVLSTVNNIAILNVIVWIPLIIALVEQYWQKKKFRYAILLSLVSTIQLFGGHLQFVYYTHIFLVFYVIFFLEGNLIPKLKLLVIFYVMFIVFSSPQLVLFFELSSQTTRSSNLKFASSGNLSILSLPRLILANFYGSLRGGSSWGPQSQMDRGLADVTGYIGVVPLVLAIINIIISRGRKNFMLLLLGIGSLIISLGSTTPFYKLLYEVIPFFNRFRNPSQLHILYTFPLCLLAAFSLENMSIIAKKIKGKWQLVILFNILTLIMISIFLFVLANIKSPAYSNEKLSAIIANIASNTILIEIFLSLVFVAIIKNVRVKETIILVTAIDLLIFSTGNIITVPSRKTYEMDKRAAVFLSENLGLHRYFSTADAFPYTGLDTYYSQIMVREPFGESRFDDGEQNNFSHFQQITKQLPPDLGMYFNLLTVNGYEAVILSSYAKYWTDEKAINRITINDINDDRFDLAGVKYLLATTDFQSQIDKGKWSKRANFGTLDIYENKNVWPRVFLWDGNKISTGSAIITKYSPNSVKIEVDSPEKSTLVLTDTYYSNWKAYVNGKEEKVDRFQGVFRMIKVLKGVSSVIFKYEIINF